MIMTNTETNAAKDTAAAQIDAQAAGQTTAQPNPAYGKIYIVGLGPGDRDHFSYRAVAAIQDSHVIAGYGLYVDLVRDLTEGKEIISKGMKREIERANLAIAEAKKGKNVAVISGGDPGVYGMAGIVLELVDDDIEVEVVPGITAATAAAASLGAPLMHDFAIISLSDLLTPYDKIMDRIKHCSMADMALVIYNPRSLGRQKHLEDARRIMLEYKSPQTPVGLVRNAKRGEEEVVITTLENLPNEEVDMLTVVLVGNSETRIQNGKMITPRGYHKKDEYTGVAKGE